MNEPPITRPHKEEIDGYMHLICAESALLEHADVLEKRLKTIPNAWRDYKMVTTIMRKLADKLIHTFTMEKRYTVKAMMPDLRYQIRYRKKVGRDEESVTAIKTSDLDLLCSVCMEYGCRICDGQCERCDLGKVFDSLLNIERKDGESYAFMNANLAGFKHVGMKGENDGK